MDIGLAILIVVIAYFVIVGLKLSIWMIFFIIIPVAIVVAILRNNKRRKL